MTLLYIKWLQIRTFTIARTRFYHQQLRDVPIVIA